MTSPEPLPELIAFVERQVRNAKHDAFLERRAVERDLLVVPAIAQPVDSQLQPLGPSFTVVTRDISAEGVGLIHVSSIQEEFLALQLTLDATLINLACKTLWSRPFGPFYYLGCRFIKKLNVFPSRRDPVSVTNGESGNVAG